MKERASLTARMCAFGRIYHAEHTKKCAFDDRMARALMTVEEYAQIERSLREGAAFFAPDGVPEKDELRWIVNTQIAPTPVGRSAYCERAVNAALHSM